MDQDYEARRHAMADDAGKQLLRVVLNALDGHGFDQRFQPLGPIEHVVGTPSFSLAAELSGERYRLSLRTAFHVAGGRLPGTITFQGHPLNLTITRNDNGATARRSLEYKVRQIGDEVTMLIPAATILAEVESAITEISR